VSPQTVIANGQPIAANLPCTLEEFVVSQNLSPCSMVV
jgi:hypothetical protein